MPKKIIRTKNKQSFLIPVLVVILLVIGIASMDRTENHGDIVVAEKECKVKIDWKMVKPTEDQLRAEKDRLKKYKDGDVAIDINDLYGNLPLVMGCEEKLEFQGIKDIFNKALKEALK